MEAELSAEQGRLQESAEFEFRKKSEETRRREFERTEERLRRGQQLQGAVNLTRAGIEIGRTKIGAAAYKKIGERSRGILGIGAKGGGATSAAGLFPIIPGGAGAGVAAATAGGGLAIGGAGAGVAAAKVGAGIGLKTAGASALSIAGPASIGAFVGEKVGGKTGAIVGGAATGFAFGGPVGGAIGAVVGLASGGTVICTELHRQGYIPVRVLGLDSHKLHDDIDEETYSGYMRWAPYIVKGMRKSKIITWFIKPFGVGWAYHMAHKLDSSIPDSLIGKVLYKIGVPACKWLGQRRQRQWHLKIF